MPEVIAPAACILAGMTWIFGIGSGFQAALVPFGILVAVALLGNLLWWGHR